MTKTRTTKRVGFLTFPVAGAAYGKRGQLLSDESEGLTHSYNPETDSVACGKVKAKNILEDYAFDTAAVPTCPYCLKRDARF